MSYALIGIAAILVFFAFRVGAGRNRRRDLLAVLLVFLAGTSLFMAGWEIGLFYMGCRSSVAYMGFGKITPNLPGIILGKEGRFNVIFSNRYGAAIIIKGVNVVGGGESCSREYNESLGAGENFNVEIDGCLQGKAGEKSPPLKVTIDYSTDNGPAQEYGEITGIFE